MLTGKLKVLIADDEEHIRELLGQIMTHLNFDIVGKAANGFEAEKMYKENIPDLLLLDINMPVKSGVEVLEELIKEFPDAFIIMLTAVSDVHSVKKCISLGAAYFIRKDTPMPKMVILLQETIENFERKRKLNQGKYNLNMLLREIKEDENKKS